MLLWFQSCCRGGVAACTNNDATTKTKPPSEDERNPGTADLEQGKRGKPTVRRSYGIPAWYNTAVYPTQQAIATSFFKKLKRYVEVKNIDRFNEYTN